MMSGYGTTIAQGMMDQASTIASQDRAHKQALSDNEMQGKIKDLIGKRQSLVEKIPTLKGTPDYEPAIKELQEIHTGLREAYDHKTNPGAIQKFGHLLTDHLGIKVTDSNSEGLGIKGKESLSDYRKGKEYDKKQADLAGDLKQAEQDIAAGPLSPEQQAVQGVQTDSAKRLAQFNSDIAFHKSQNPHAYGPDATPEEKQMVEDYRNERVQYYGQGIKPVQPKESDEYWTDVKGAVPQEYPKGSGKYRIEQKNKKGERHWNDEPEDYTPPAPKVKPNNTAKMIGLDSYAKSHGYPSFNDIPDEYREKVNDYEIRKEALDHAIPKSTTSTRVMPDANGVPQTVIITNYTTPGGNVQLIDPMPVKKVSEQPEVGSSQPSTPSNPVVHGSNKKNSKTATPPPSGSGNVKVGAPLPFQMKTPAIAKAQNDVVDATKLYSIAKQVEAKPNDAFNQKRLAVQLERASAGRFTVQALDYVKQMGWGATLQEWAKKPTTGALSPQLVRQLIDGARENLIAAQESLKAALTPVSPSGNTNPQSGGGSPKGATHIFHNPDDNKDYYVDEQGNNLGEVMK
jgi:hypothetical protein